MTDFPYYKVVFVIEILVAEFLFMSALKKKAKFALRYSFCALVLIAAGFLPSFSNIWLNSVIFLLLFAMTIPLMKLCYDDSWLNITFCAIAAYTLQHFSYEFVNFVLTLIVWGKSPLFGIYSATSVEIRTLDKQAIFWLLAYLLCYFTTYTGAYFTFCRRLKKLGTISMKNSWLLLFVGIGVFTNIIFNSFFISLKGDYEVAINLLVCIYNCFCCFLLLEVQFSLLRSKKLEDELDFMREMLEKEKAQYSLLSKNINMVNIKCHDIKYQIRKIGGSASLPKDTIAEIEAAVDIYSSLAKTGNEVVDTILTENILYCKQNDIILSYMVQGEKLSFMKDDEIYSLFGNTIGNAIEAVMKLKESSKRVITVKVFSVENFVAINIANYFAGEIIYDEDGLPKTQKNSKKHGYGMKSVNYIVSLYKGSLATKIKNDIFHLDILIPVPTDQIDGEAEK